LIVGSKQINFFANNDVYTMKPFLLKSRAQGVSGKNE